MSAWGIVGLVFAGLALLFAALCCIPGKLLVTYDAQEGLRLRGSVLWLKLGEKKPKPAPAPQAKKAPPKVAGKHEGGKSRILTEYAGELAQLLGKLLRQLGILVRSIVVKELRLACVVDLDDPAAAERYGKICAVLYPALGALHETLRVDEAHESVSIGCACGGKDLLEFRMLLQLRAVHVVRALLSLTPPALSFLRRVRRDGEAASRKRPPKA